MFIPTTKRELDKLNIDQLDVILVSGDVYIDSTYDGIAVIGKVLISKGFKVGIISQPNIESGTDIMRLGEPKLFWGISSGCVDSMVSNYTALLKKKRSDDLTPGGINDRRPDRATIIFTNLIKKYFKNTKPIILGGVEASLRRIAHYDYWSDKIRRSILFDSKADAIVYGMGEKTILELATKLRQGDEIHDTRGICYISKEIPNKFLELPSYNNVISDKMKFIEMFHLFYKNNDPINAKGLAQKHGDRFLIQNPPQHHLSSEELDRIHELDFERDVHPYYKSQGKVKALETTQFSINSHRGCYGECNFCSIAVHQGRTIISRSEPSIIKEVKHITNHKGFKGNIADVGGPTANMYGSDCNIQMTKGSCKSKRCAFPEKCPKMNQDHKRQINLLKRIRAINGVKKVFIGSGIRYDLIVGDDKFGRPYLENLVEHHVSGQLKIAPEHISHDVLKAMGKPKNESLLKFKNDFEKISRQKNKKQYLTYYLIASHPGCNEGHMRELKHFLDKELKINPEQVQVFTPTPSTYATLMYYTGIDPFSMNKVFVEKNLRNKRSQKEVLFASNRRKR